MKNKSSHEREVLAYWHTLPRPWLAEARLMLHQISVWMHVFVLAFGGVDEEFPECNSILKKSSLLIDVYKRPSK